MLDIQKPKKSCNYEGVVILHPDCTEEEQKSFFQKNKGIIGEYDGEIFSLDTWGKRKLANMIGNCARGIYFHVTFTAGPGVIAELERTMRINDRVLRFNHTKIDSRTSLQKYMDDFKGALQETMKREKEREEKFKAKKAAAAAKRRS